MTFEILVSTDISYVSITSFIIGYWLMEWSRFILCGANSSSLNRLKCCYIFWFGRVFIMFQLFALPHFSKKIYFLKNRYAKKIQNIFLSAVHVFYRFFDFLGRYFLFDLLYLFCTPRCQDPLRKFSFETIKIKLIEFPSLQNAQHSNREVYWFYTISVPSPVPVLCRSHYW